jgi:hypothetical protein
MSDLVVLDFDGVDTADEVLTKLRGMQNEDPVDLEDACVWSTDGLVQFTPEQSDAPRTVLKQRIVARQGMSERLTNEISDGQRRED